jgi:fructose-1,6-bisphosphatase/inositol monophosphatase family enzyme
MPDLYALHRQMVPVLHSVGQDILMRHFQKLSDSQVFEKGPDDLVTIADHESEAALSSALARILPKASIVGEEAAAADPNLAKQLGDPYVWIIDPIDGTTNFASGKAPFGILVALASRGETIAGWLHDPITGRICHAYKGQGAFINDQTVRARPSGSAKPIAAISTLFVEPHNRAALIELGTTHYQMVDIPRCAAEQYPRLVTGENDITLFERTLAWDHAAGALFLNEAGGKCARFDGSHYRVDDRRSGMIAAASPALWDQAAAIFSN